MDKYVIMGGNPLTGSVKINGAKNAVLPILAACLLSQGVCTINNVPRLKDVFVMKEVLELLGAKTEIFGNTMKIDSSKVNSVEISESLMRKMRASNLVMGPLLSRFGYVKLSYPGGCSIGSRPMDFHLKGLKLMGAIINEKFGFVEASSNSLQGCDICLDFPSVGATENLMMAACLAKDVTVIRNAAREPEIVDLQNFLNNMGAKIKGAGTDCIKIEGVKELGETNHTVIPDRIEAGTFMIASAITRGDVTLENVILDHIEPIISKLKEAGVVIEEGNDSIRVLAKQRLKAVDFKTLPYPGFPTDMQPQVMALMSTCDGTSVISEGIFENRFKHVDELRRMGAEVKVEGRAAIIKGVKSLSGTLVEASDLRAGAALVLAGLTADDITIVKNLQHIDRGYENFDRKLRDLGAKIIRVNGDVE